MRGGQLKHYVLPLFGLLSPGSCGESKPVSTATLIRVTTQTSDPLICNLRLSAQSQQAHEAPTASQYRPSPAYLPIVGTAHRDRVLEGKEIVYIP
jgi:hypothetical protein